MCSSSKSLDAATVLAVLKTGSLILQQDVIITSYVGGANIAVIGGAGKIRKIAQCAGKEILARFTNNGLLRASGRFLDVSWNSNIRQLRHNL